MSLLLGAPRRPTGSEALARSNHDELTRQREEGRQRYAQRRYEDYLKEASGQGAAAPVAAVPQTPQYQPAMPVASGGGAAYDVAGQTEALERMKNELLGAINSKSTAGPPGQPQVDTSTIVAAVREQFGKMNIQAPALDQDDLATKIANAIKSPPNAGVTLEGINGAVAEAFTLAGVQKIISDALGGKVEALTGQAASATALAASLNEAITKASSCDPDQIKKAVRAVMQETDDGSVKQVLASAFTDQCITKADGWADIVGFFNALQELKTTAEEGAGGSAPNTGMIGKFGAAISGVVGGLQGKSPQEQGALSALVTQKLSEMTRAVEDAKAALSGPAGLPQYAILSIIRIGQQNSADEAWDVVVEFARKLQVAYQELGIEKSTVDSVIRAGLERRAYLIAQSTGAHALSRETFKLNGTTELSEITDDGFKKAIQGAADLVHDRVFKEFLRASSRDISEEIAALDRLRAIRSSPIADDVLVEVLQRAAVLGFQEAGEFKKTRLYDHAMFYIGHYGEELAGEKLADLLKVGGGAENVAFLYNEVAKDGEGVLDYESFLQEARRSSMNLYTSSAAAIQVARLDIRDVLREMKKLPAFACSKPYVDRINELLEAAGDPDLEDEDEDEDQFLAVVSSPSKKTPQQAASPSSGDEDDPPQDTPMAAVVATGSVPKYPNLTYDDLEQSQIPERYRDIIRKVIENKKKSTLMTPLGKEFKEGDDNHNNEDFQKMYRLKIGLDTQFFRDTATRRNIFSFDRSKLTALLDYKGDVNKDVEIVAFMNGTDFLTPFLKEDKQRTKPTCPPAAAAGGAVATQSPSSSGSGGSSSSDSDGSPSPQVGLPAAVAKRPPAAAAPPAAETPPPAAAGTPRPPQAEVWNLGMDDVSNPISPADIQSKLDSDGYAVGILPKGGFTVNIANIGGVINIVKPSDEFLVDIGALDENTYTVGGDESMVNIRRSAGNVRFTAGRGEPRSSMPSLQNLMEKANINAENIQVKVLIQEFLDAASETRAVDFDRAISNIDNRMMGLSLKDISTETTDASRFIRLFNDLFGVEEVTVQFNVGKFKLSSRSKVVHAIDYLSRSAGRRQLLAKALLDNGKDMQGDDKKAYDDRIKALVGTNGKENSILNHFVAGTFYGYEDGDDGLLNTMLKQLQESNTVVAGLRKKIGIYADGNALVDGGKAATMFALFPDLFKGTGKTPPMVQPGAKP